MGLRNPKSCFAFIAYFASAANASVMDNFPLGEVEDIETAMAFVNDNAVKHENTPYSLSTVFIAASANTKSQSSQHEERKHNAFSPPHTLQQQNNVLKTRYVPT